MNIYSMNRETSYNFQFRVEEEDYYVVVNRHRTSNTYEDVTFLVKKHNIESENLYGQTFECMPKKNINFHFAEMVLRAYLDIEKVRKLYEQKYKECNEKQRQIDELMERLEGNKDED